MQLVIPHDSREDCSLRWQNCYCVYTPTGGDSKYLYINSIRALDGDRALIRGSIFKPDDGMWEAVPEFWVSNSEVDLTHMHSGNVDVGNACRYVSRHRGGSYRLGACEQRYVVHTPSSGALRALGMSSRASFGAIVPRLYDPKYRSIKESVRLILDKSVVSSSVTKELSLGIAIRLKNLGLFKGTALIGEYDIENEVAMLPYRHRYFSEEVQEAGFTVILKEEPSNATGTE